MKNSLIESGIGGVCWTKMVCMNQEYDWVDYAGIWGEGWSSRIGQREGRWEEWFGEGDSRCRLQKSIWPQRKCSARKQRWLIEQLIQSCSACPRTNGCWGKLFEGRRVERLESTLESATKSTSRDEGVRRGHQTTIVLVKLELIVELGGHQSERESPLQLYAGRRENLRVLSSHSKNPSPSYMKTGCWGSREGFRKDRRWFSE